MDTLALRTCRIVATIAERLMRPRWCLARTSSSLLLCGIRSNLAAARSAARLAAQAAAPSADRLAAARSAAQLAALAAAPSTARLATLAGARSAARLAALAAAPLAARSPPFPAYDGAAEHWNRLNRIGRGNGVRGSKWRKNVEGPNCNKKRGLLEIMDLNGTVTVIMDSNRDYGCI